MLIGGGYLICVASVWNKEKGFDDILQLRKLLPHDELIVMVGVTSKQRESLPEGIIGIERTSNVDELSMLYAGADVFLNPTWGDNFPTVNIEALACAKPVVTYKTGGSPEALDDNSGIVVQQGNIQGLVDAIFRIKQSPFHYNASHCRLRAVKYFNKASKYQEYIDLYESIL